MFPVTLTIPVVIFLTFIFILTSIMLFQKRQKDHPKRPPGPPSLPIIGNLHMLGERPYRSLESLAKIYGPIMSLKLGRVPAVVVSSPEAAEQILKTHDTVFASRPKVQSTDPFDRGVRGVAFAEYGPYWRYVRKVCTLHLLSVSRVETLAPLRKEEVGATVKSLERASTAGEVVNVSEKVGELLENVMYRMVLGRRKDERFQLKGLMSEVLNLVGQFNFADHIPWLAPFDLQGLTRKLRRNRKALDDALEKIIAEHELAPKAQNVQNHNDFIHILLSLLHRPMDLLHDGDDQDHAIDRPNLTALLLDMILAATDTSTVAIEWALSELLRNPRVMKNLQHELQNVVGMNRMVEEVDLANLSYLDMVIKETLRLHPPGPLLIPRETMEDATVNGYYISKKTRILVNVWAIGRDPNVWSENAHVFYPERFVDSDIDVRGHDFQLLPFGSGRRGCAGTHLGLTMVKFVLAQLVHCFNWDLPCGICPSDLDMNEKFGLTIPRNEHLLAIPTYRLHN